MKNATYSKKSTTDRVNQASFLANIQALFTQKTSQSFISRPKEMGHLNAIQETRKFISKYRKDFESLAKN